MKKSLLIMLLLVPFYMVSCQASGDEKSKVNEEVTEKKQNEEDKKSKKATIQLTKEEFKNKVMDYENNENWEFAGDKPCLIDFYADWCGPCRITSPILEDLAKKYKGQINIYKVDVDVEKELASVFGVQSIPTFLNCPMEGKPSLSSGIGRSKEDTKQMFINNIEKILLKE